jgi:uncharacterized protein YndB with AHSA1/START domain
MTFELTISRMIPASPEEVFDAYTDPEKQRIWFNIIGEPGIIEATADLRVGGYITNVWGKSEDELFRETNTIRVFDRPTHLATSSSGSDPSGMTMDTEVDIRFEAVDGGTLMTVVQSGFPTEEMRDFFSTYAWVGAFDRITKFLEQAAV